MFKKFRIVFVRSTRSKDDFDDQFPDPPKTEKHKTKSKFRGLFRSASDQDLHTEPSKSKRSFLRRKKTRDDKALQHEVSNGVIKDQTDIFTDNLIADNPLPENSLPAKLPPENPLPDNSLPGKLPPENPLPDNQELVDHELLEEKVNENDHRETEVPDSILPVHEAIAQDELPKDAFPLKTFDSPPTVLPHPFPVEPILSDPLPPDDKAWKRAKEVWEKNETEETNENKEERKRRKEKKHHSHRTKDGTGEERESKHHSKSKHREKEDKENGGARAESTSRSKERKKHDKETRREDKHERHEEKRDKDEKHRHKSKSEKHGRKHGEEEGDDDIYDDENKNHVRHKHKDHKQKHSEKLRKNKEETHVHRHDEKHKNTEEKHSARKHSDKHHKDTDHKDTDRKHTDHKNTDHKNTDHKHTTEHRKKHVEVKEDKRIELDKVWREYEYGKRYYSTEKDMKKVIDRLDGVDRYRREERQRSSDRSYGFSSDTSCEVGHRSRSRERRRRSRSREKPKPESDQDSNPSNTWQYSLGRIEARQEQCKADIDTARRSIEHRIKQLEMKLEKQYSSSERLPVKTPAKIDANKDQDVRNIVDKVADECREVTRTLEVRTEEMKSEIASVVREQFQTNLDERHRDKSPTSPTSLYGMQVVENYRCDVIHSEPTKPTNDVTTSLTTFERLSSADESMITVIEENCRSSRSSPQCVTNQSYSLSTSRDSPIRVSQSGALDTQNEPAVSQATNTSTIDPGTSLEHPDSPLQARSQAFENLYELSMESLEDEESLEEGEEGPNSVGTPESLQMMYRRKIRETEDRCQERSVEEKELLYKRINELESMLLAARSSKGDYV